MKTYNDGVEWAALWIEGSLTGETNERVIGFGKNMAKSLRASLLDTKLAADLAQRCVNCNHAGKRALGGFCNERVTGGYCWCKCVFPATGAETQRGADTNWPLSDVLTKAVEWLRHLNDHHNCDCHGWEERSFIIEAAERYANEIAATGAEGGEQQCDECQADNGWHRTACSRHPRFATPPVPAASPADAEKQAREIELALARKVVQRAQQFCEEVSEDSEDVPQVQLRWLNEALDAYEGLPPDKAFDDSQPLFAALSTLTADEHATDSQRRIATLAIQHFTALSSRPVVAPQPSLETIYMAIEDALNSYRMHHTRELPDLENGLSLLDGLTPDDDKDVTRGREELDSLIDYVCGAVGDVFRAAVVAPVETENEGKHVASSTCENCGGSGKVPIGCAIDAPITVPCADCNGTGRRPSRRGAPNADPTRFVERSFAVVENAGHSIRLIKRDDPRQAISIPWADLASLHELLIIILKDEVPVKSTASTPSEAALSAAREIAGWLDRTTPLSLGEPGMQEIAAIISRHCAGEMK